MSNLRPSQRNKYRALYEFAHGIATVKSTPTHLEVGRTNTCNFKCVYCPDHRVGNNIPRDSLEGEVWKRLLALIPQSDILGWTGISEFLMDPEFFDVVGRCADAGATLKINTNGSVCTPKHLDALANYPGHLSIIFSVDAATPETFKRIRGWDFERVIRNIKTYVERFKARRRDRTWVTMAFVILKSNVNEMESFVSLAKDMNVDGIRFMRLLPGSDWEIATKAGGKFDYRKELATEYPDEYNRAIERARRMAEQLGIYIEIPAPVTEAELREARQ